MKYHLVSLESDIQEYTYDEGVGESTSCGYTDEKIGKTFDSLEDMAHYLAKYYFLPESLDDYEQEGTTLRTSQLRANHSAVQNGGWFDPTDAELDAWEKGTIKLYCEDSTIHYITCN